jgi:hypothetical protein
MAGNGEGRQPNAFGRRAEARRASAAETALDAEFITLPADAPPDALRDLPDRSAAGADVLRTTPGMALFAEDAVPAAPPTDDRIAFYGFSAALVLLAFWVSGLHVLSQRFVFNAAKPGLALESVGWRVEAGAAGPALLVEGWLRNDGKAMAALAPVDVVVRAADGRVTSFKINPGEGALPPGRSLGVSGRLDLMATGSIRPGQGRALDRAPAAIETVTVTLSR